MDTDILTIENSGPRLTNTNYWDSELASWGKFFFSVNAGCIRMLVPESQESCIKEMKTGKDIVISKGPWPAEKRDLGIEIMFDDHSEEPFTIHVGVEQWDTLPKVEAGKKRWEFAVYTRGKIHFQKKCYVRDVEKIPDMSAIL